MSLKFKTTFQMYNISPTGHIAGSIDSDHDTIKTNLMAGGDYDESYMKTFSTWFLANVWPDDKPTSRDGGGDLEPKDMSSYFTKVNYTNLNDAKAEVMSTTLTNAVASHTLSCDFALESGNLTMSPTFAETSNRDAFLDAISDWTVSVKSDNANSHFGVYKVE
jgi:hypothetical protein